MEFGILVFDFFLFGLHGSCPCCGQVGFLKGSVSQSLAQYFYVWVAVLPGEQGQILFGHCASLAFTCL